VREIQKWLKEREKERKKENEDHYWKGKVQATEGK
jgi:hypothetical protein